MTGVRRHYESHFLSYELVASVLVTGLSIAIIELVWGRGKLVDSLDGSRQALYAAIASIAGSLVGFTVTTVSIILALADSPRLRLVRESRHYDTVFQVFFSAIKFLALATGWALVALLWDRDKTPRAWISYVALWTVLIASFRLYRCVWVLEHVIRLAVRKPEGDTPARSVGKPSA